MPSLLALARHSARRPTLVGAVGILLSQTACYTYRPAAPTRLQVGGDVHLVLTRDGTAELQPLLGPDVRRINGQIEETAGDTSVVILLDEVVTGDGATLPWRRGRVTIPVRTLASVEQRTLDRGRTRTFVAVAAATFVAIVVAAIKRAGYSGSSKSGPGSGPPE